MREENKSVGVQIMKEPVVVSIERIPIPIPKQRVQSDESEETIEVQSLLQADQAVGQIFFAAGRNERFEV